MFFWHPAELLVIPAMILAIWAQFKVKASFSKYAKVGVASGMSGAKAARRILDSQGLYDVPIEVSRGMLSDHYDPTTKVVRLSEEVYYGNSISSVAVAAHEVGHAVQHDTSYVPLQLRHGIFPVVNIGSTLAMPMFILGMFMRTPFLMVLGIFAFTLAVLFQVVTLPVEYNASSRALGMLGAQGVVSREEEGMAKKVLDAAALTYLAATLVAVMELIKLVIMYTSSSDD
ncbi:MAG TPA: zinc metallopeptidase [Verrucomicrobiae bacterium]|nr:zinc metallopeptidase [Verrucomicrobiae bacterium]